MSAVAVACLAVTLVGVAARADRLAERERKLTAAVAERDRLDAERATLSQEAAPLVSAITRMKSESRGARAGRDLEDRLQKFDRVARHLDNVERRRAEASQAIARALRAVDDEIDAELQRVPKPTGSGGALAAELEARRRRAHALVEPEGQRRFRPPIDVTLNPEDTPDAIHAKLEIIAAERGRLREEASRLEHEQALVAARITLKRQLAAELEAAQHEGGQTADLVRREIDDLFRERRDLETLGRKLDREHDELDNAGAHLADRSAEMERRLRELGASPAEVVTP